MEKTHLSASSEKSAVSSLVKMVKRCVPDSVKLASKARLRPGGRIGLNLPDRIFLEQVSIPWFAEQEETRSVLDVGTDWYTWKYEVLFPGMEYQSIDFDAAKAKFASPNHVVGSILELDQYFEENRFDLIICNGVFGWGVDDCADIETAVSQFFRVLRPGGYLVIGWNDNDDHRPEGFEKTDVKGFERFVLPPIESDHFNSAGSNRHQFRFYRSVKSASVSSQHETIL
ncbi:MAG: class I SAM-dependent methyltransferase [Verrucomicrobiales bacterium]|nr:class I SAM-dependent methyltransferase [Verrucomicrobiales bacterium]